MKPFYHAVGFRMVRRSGAVFDAPVLEELSPDRRRKLRASVGGNNLWYAILGNPPMIQGVDDGVGGNVLDGDGCGPSRMAINDCQEVGETI